MLIHWAALGGHNELVQHFLSLGVPVDPEDDVRNLSIIILIIIISIIILGQQTTTNNT